VNKNWCVIQYSMSHVYEDFLTKEEALALIEIRRKFETERNSWVAREMTTSELGESNAT